MKRVAKYNTCKAFSTVLTVGTPVATMACCGDMFIHRSDTAISAAAVFAFLLSLLFVKDKILSFIKSPTALKISVIGLVCCVVLGNLIDTLKIVFFMTILASVVDEITFKRIYNNILFGMPEKYEQFLKFGFLCTTTKKIEELETKEEAGGETDE